MLSFLRNTLRLKKKSESSKDILIARWLRETLGYKPENIHLFLSVFSLKEKSGSQRLELLGDSVLSLAVLDYLFHKFPKLDEGQLTQIKSRIVSRQHLNEIGKKMGIPGLCMSIQEKIHGVNAPGDLLESLLGAMYMDAGYLKASRIIHRKIFQQFCHLEKIIEQDDDYKSRFLIFCQRKKWSVKFESEEVSPENGKRKFLVRLIVNGKMFMEAYGYKKKNIEQNLSYHALLKFHGKE